MRKMVKVKKFEREAKWSREKETKMAKEGKRK